MIIEKNNYFTSSTGSMSSMSKIFLSEYYMFVQDEVHDAGNAEGEDIANQHIPSAGEAFDKQQRTHLNQECAGTGEVVARVMAEKRAERVRRNTVAPYGVVRKREIGQHGTFERYERRQQVLAPVIAFEQIVRTEPQHAHVHRRSCQRGEQKAEIPDCYAFIPAHFSDV